MKGLELPINMIIIIAIAVLVLVVIAAFFTGYFGTGTGTISLEDAFSKGCAALRSGYECKPSNVQQVTIPGYHAFAGDTATHYLNEICEKKGISMADGGIACARACGCLVSA